MYQNSDACLTVAVLTLGSVELSAQTAQNAQEVLIVISDPRADSSPLGGPACQRFLVGLGIDWQLASL